MKIKKYFADKETKLKDFSTRCEEDLNKDEVKGKLMPANLERMRQASVILLLVLVSLSCKSLPRTTYYGTYKEMSISTLVEKFGNPSADRYYIVDDKYEYRPLDPGYSEYFTKEEIHKGVMIRFTAWDISINKEILVWSKLENFEWIIFDSVEYDPETTIIE